MHDTKQCGLYSLGTGSFGSWSDLSYRNKTVRRVEEGRNQRKEEPEAGSLFLFVCFGFCFLLIFFLSLFFGGGCLFLVCRLDVFLRCSNVIEQGHWDWRRMKRFKGSLKNRSGVHDCCWNAEGEGGGRFRFWYRCSVIGWMQKAWGEKGSFLNALWWCPAENAELGLGEGWTVNTTLV